MSALGLKIGYLLGMKSSYTAMVLRRVVECTRVSHFIDFDEYLQFSFFVLTWLFNVGVK